MTAMVYSFKEAAHFRAGFNRDAAAARLGSLLERDGYLSNEAIIEDGLREDSPLHPQFSFTADEALAEVHERQAEYLKRTFVTIIREDDDEEAREIRAVVPVYTREHPEERRYIATVEALSDAEYREQVLSQALSEMLALRRKYTDIQEFARIFKAIDAVAAKRAA